MAPSRALIFSVFQDHVTRVRPDSAARNAVGVVLGANVAMRACCLRAHPVRATVRTICGTRPPSRPAVTSRRAVPSPSRSTRRTAQGLSPGRPVRNRRGWRPCRSCSAISSATASRLVPGKWRVRQADSDLPEPQRRWNLGASFPHPLSHGGGGGGGSSTTITWDRASPSVLVSPGIFIDEGGSHATLFHHPARGVLAFGHPSRIQPHPLQS